MNLENRFKFTPEESKCQKCGREIKEGGGNVCRHCLIEMSDGSLRKEDFDGTDKANQPHKTRNKKEMTH